MKARACVARVAAFSIVCACGSSAAGTDESCLFTTDEQIAGVIELNLQTLQAKRMAAQSCPAQNSQTPP
jgi:hypothetical protein